LKDHAESKKLEFLCTPFSAYAVDLLDSIGIVAWKIGSGDVGQEWLLEKITQTRKPVIFSTGMSSIEGVDALYKYFREKKIDFSVLQCTSMYPTPLDKTGIRILQDYMARYDVPVGLSNHSGSIWPSVYAIALGAKVIEVHIKLNDFAFGPDTSSSLSVEDLRTLVEARNAFSVMEESNEDKNLSLKNLTNDKQIFSRSISLDRNYPKGTVIEEKMILMRKPGSGIPETEIQNFIGRKLCRDYDSYYLLDLSDVETP
jgi:N-acetylneuraminate synthase